MLRYGFLGLPAQSRPWEVTGLRSSHWCAWHFSDQTSQGAEKELIFKHDYLSNILDACMSIYGCWNIMTFPQKVGKYSETNSRGPGWTLPTLGRHL